MKEKRKKCSEGGRKRREYRSDGGKLGNKEREEKRKEGMRWEGNVEDNIGIH